MFYMGLFLKLLIFFRRVCLGDTHDERPDRFDSGRKKYLLEEPGGYACVSHSRRGGRAEDNVRVVLTAAYLVSCIGQSVVVERETAHAREERERKEKKCHQKVSIPMQIMTVIAQVIQYFFKVRYQGSQYLVLKKLCLIVIYLFLLSFLRFFMWLTP